MTAHDKLIRMNACRAAVDWIGGRTIEQAWQECRRSEWMVWLLEHIAPDDHRRRLAAADFAERVLRLIDGRAAPWAIDAARRSDDEEMDAASDAAYAAASDAARSFTSRTDESAAQADILRQYFSAREVGDLFRRATA